MQIITSFTYKMCEKSSPEKTVLTIDHSSAKHASQNWKWIPGSSFFIMTIRSLNLNRRLAYLAEQCTFYLVGNQLPQLFAIVEIFMCLSKRSMQKEKQICQIKLQTYRGWFIKANVDVPKFWQHINAQKWTSQYLLNCMG